MTSRSALRFSGIWLLMGLLFWGCCETAEKEAAQAKEKVVSMETKLAGLKLRAEELEPYKAKFESCDSELEAAKQNVEKLGQQEALIEQRHQTVKRLLEKLKGVIEAGDLSVRIRQGRMMLALPSAVLFQSGKADLSDKGKTTLDSVAEVLKEIKNRQFQIAGHTDKVPVSENNPYGSNWHLSTARAIEVLLYLKEKGVSPRKMSASGYAQYQPIASNKTQRGQAKNRRIEITLMPNLAELPDLSRLAKKLGLAGEKAED